MSKPRFKVTLFFPTIGQASRAELLLQSLKRTASPKDLLELSELIQQTHAIRMGTPVRGGPRKNLC